MNGMPEVANNVVDWKSRLQIHGVLWKRSSAQSKWMRRYFVVKDGWLFYYSETEKKDFGRRTHFNIHPKVAIPLSECHIVTSEDLGQPFAFKISSDEIEVDLMLAADKDCERDKWTSTLEKSKRITWANQQLSDDLIRQLEEHGLSMAKQKQQYFDRLQSEVMELADEKEKSWELARLNEELEKEKKKMEEFAEGMKNEYEKVKREMDDMQSYLTSLDAERTALHQKLTSQVSELQKLAEEKETILKTLKEQESVTEQLSQEKQQTEQNMRKQLEEIEKQTHNLLAEQAEAEIRLQENAERANDLEEEKEMISEQARELQATIKELIVQKEMTEAELKEEVIARMDAERRLQEAEKSVQGLGHAVDHQTPDMNVEVKEQMKVNVNKLKEFFENLAQEAKVDPDKPVIIKNTIHARKTMMRRNKTRKFERRKSNSMRAKTMNFEQIFQTELHSPNNRRVQSLFIHSTSKCDDDDATETLIVPKLKELYSEHL